MMKISYKLTKRTKAEKFENSMKKYNIRNFKTNCCKVTASGKIIYSILPYKLMRLVTILRLPEEYKKKQAKTVNSKKIEREKCRGH